jgi:hypothetical protein
MTTFARPVFALLIAAAGTVGGCATSVAEPKGQTTAFQERREEAALDSNTVFVKADGRAVTYTSTHLIVCEDGVNPSLITQFRGFNGQPHVVIEKADGSYDARLSEMPSREPSNYGCNDGAAWTFQLWQDDVGFLRDVDLSGEIVNGLAGKTFGCDGGFQLHSGFELAVSGFKVENGVLKQPNISVSFSGESTGVARGSCSVKATSPRLIFFAGPVPVVYEVSLSFSVEVSVSKASSMRATIGTQGGELVSDDPELQITPMLELGIVFYNAVGTYVGLDLPFNISPRPPCSPEITLSPALKVGAQAGLLGVGVGGLSFTKALGVELNTPVLGPYTIAASRCD